MWAIYDKTTKIPIWTSSNKKDLTRILLELKTALGNKFYLGEYKEKNESTS